MVQTRLDARARSLLVRAQAVGCGPGDSTDPEAALRTVSERVVTALENAATRPRRVQLLEVLTQVHALQRDLSAWAPARRLAALDGARAAIERLGATDDREELLRRAAGEACRSCGFARCVVARIVDGRWSLVVAHFADDAAEVTFADQVESSSREIEGLALESSLIRRRAAMLVDASAHAGGLLAMIEPPALRPPYLTCPIVVGPRVVGLLYAGDETGMRDVEREALTCFAAGVAQLYERATLMGKLHAQRDHVQQMASSARSVMARSDSDIELPTPSQTGQADEDRRSPAARELPQALTARELEVLALMAAGVNNAGVAERLFLAEGTVKSHVKHIFRKMGASNRAEAVARYLHHHMEDVA